MGPFDHCYKCSAKLVPGKEQCPACGAPVPLAQFTESYRRRSLLWRNLRRVLIAVLLIVVVNLYRPYLNRYLPLFGVLRFSPIVTEAINLANEHQGVFEILGSPIEIGWFVKGYINDIGSYPRESRLRIPVSGPKNGGTLFLQAGNGQGPWIFTKLELLTDTGASIDLFDHPPDQVPAMVQTNRRVYLIPLGNVGN